jgi:hypothetical protein
LMPHDRDAIYIVWGTWQVYFLSTWKKIFVCKIILHISCIGEGGAVWGLGWDWFSSNYRHRS